MSGSSTMDDTTSDHPDSLVSFMLEDFPSELRQKVWEMVAENAVVEFRSRHPEYQCTWTISHKPPYLKYDSDIMRPLVQTERPTPYFTGNEEEEEEEAIDPDSLIARDLREIFWPLFLINKESHATATQYLSKFHMRKEQPKLVINFADRLCLGLYSLDKIIRFSRRSTEELKAQAVGRPGMVFPKIIQDNYERQLEDICSVMHVTVTGAVFIPYWGNLARQTMLLRFRNLRTVYVDVEDSHRSYYYGGGADDARAYAFLEASEFRAGKFAMKYADLEAFKHAYAKEYLRASGGDGRGCEPCKAAERSWELMKAWEKVALDGLLAVVDKFLRSGIECVVVCRCWPEVVDRYYTHPASTQTVLGP
ncbi:hypothetical protein F4811DRAFT_571975 [Daldinia bambusicola]|nr:hypothetical protein F4811DRAFT_571975 [Daldinia bambusicola]